MKLGKCCELDYNVRKYHKRITEGTEIQLNVAPDGMKRLRDRKKISKENETRQDMNVPHCRHRLPDEGPPPPVETSCIIAPTPPQQQLLAGITRTSAVEVAVGDSHIGQMTFVMDRRCAFKGSTSRSW